MAKTYLSILFALVAFSVLANDSRIIAQSPGSISFVVDENLKPVDYKFTLTDGGEIAKLCMTPPMDATVDKAEKNNRLVASSFANEHHLAYQGEGPFYSTLIEAYANHMSVTLSPDMVWLLISQGFARYVDAHAEKLRPLFVDHDDKIRLTVIGSDDLFSRDTDWPKIIDAFTSQIDQHTKGDIAQVITADFSTTGPVERVASQITLMKSMDHYFVYEFFSTCGIPSITLKGTPEDWQRVLEKTQKLSQYGLDGWVKELEPILTEFVRTAEGHPNQRFWQCIVKKIREDELRASVGCGDETKPTDFDGWFLKLYPDREGKTYENVLYDESSMFSEMVRVEFNYNLLGVMSFPMELWAGFIATEVDTAANMLTPKIGWMAILSENKMETKDAAFYTIKKYWVLSLCLTVMALSILGFLGRKVIKSRRKSK